MEIEDILDTILERFPEERVAEMIDDEIASGNWLDSDWEETLKQDGFEDEDINPYNWYQEYGNGEAENTVKQKIIGYWKKNYNQGKSLDENLRIKLEENIGEEYYLIP
mgnify:CR=1 FL=1